MDKLTHKVMYGVRKSPHMYCRVKLAYVPPPEESRVMKTTSKIKEDNLKMQHYFENKKDVIFKIIPGLSVYNPSRPCSWYKVTLKTGVLFELNTLDPSHAFTAGCKILQNFPRDSEDSTGLCW